MDADDADKFYCTNPELQVDLGFVTGPRFRGAGTQ